MLKGFFNDATTNLINYDNSDSFYGNAYTVTSSLRSISVNVFSGKMVYLYICIVLVFCLFRQLQSLNPHYSFLTTNIFQYNDATNSLFIILYSVFFFLFTYNYNTVSNFALALGLLVQPVLLSPLTYLIVFGTSSLLCISLCQKKSIIATLINDLIALFSFTLRFISQYIRIILITTVFLLLYEYINVGVSNALTSTNLFTVTIGSWVTFILRILIELVDCFFILLVQISTFFTVLL